MNIRLIAGTYGKRILKAPDSSRTHPMSERVRGSLFNIIAGKLDGSRVLDAFAGTGSLGLEALSRGAAHATFIERDRAAQYILQENIETIGVQASTKLIKSSVASWLETAKGQKFDIIFVDPPYHDTQFSTVERLLGLLKPNGLMVLSHPGKGEISLQNGIVVVDNRSYGNAYLTLFRRESA